MSKKNSFLDDTKVFGRTFSEIEMSNIDKKETSKKQKVLIGVLIVVIISLLLFSFYILKNKKEEKIVKEKYTIVKKDVSFSFNGEGEVSSDDEREYEIIKGDNIEYITSFTKKKNDKIKKDEKLFEYEETTISKTPTIVEKRSEYNGDVIDINENRIKIRTIYSFGILGIFEYTAKENECVVITKENNVALAKVKSVNNNDVLLEIIKMPIEFNETGKVNLKFVGDELSNQYNCNSFGYNFQTNKITHNDSESSEKYSVEKTLNVTTKEITLDEKDAIIDFEDKKYKVANNEIKIKIGDKITENQLIANSNYLLYEKEKKSIFSEINGIVSNVTEDKISILNTDVNHLEFEIPIKYKDKIAVNQNVSIEIKGLKISAKINEIKEEENKQIAKIINGNFKDYEILDAATITIEAEEKDLLLLPKRFVKDNKVIKIIDDKRIETELELEEYNSENYIIISNLNEGDKIEQF